MIMFVLSWWLKMASVAPYLPSFQVWRGAEVGKTPFFGSPIFPDVFFLTECVNSGEIFPSELIF
jgi:hypothetical protein